MVKARYWAALSDVERHTFMEFLWTFNCNFSRKGQNRWNPKINSKTKTLSQGKPHHHKVGVNGMPPFIKHKVPIATAETTIKTYYNNNNNLHLPLQLEKAQDADSFSGSLGPSRASRFCYFLVNKVS